MVANFLKIVKLSFTLDAKMMQENANVNRAI